MKSQDLFDKASKAWREVQEEAAERVAKIERYVAADLDLFPAELPELPADTVLAFEEYGFNIGVPAGTDLAPWLEAFQAADWKVDGRNSSWNLVRGLYQEDKDNTGHDTRTWRYVTVRFHFLRSKS